jgi:hypothetical protein
MNYQEIIESVSAIVEDDRIIKKGLMLVYKLDSKNHKEINEFLFYKANPTADRFIPTDEFEITLGGILVKFVKETSSDVA